LFREYCGFALHFRVLIGAIRKIVSGLSLLMKQFVTTAFFQCKSLASVTFDADTNGSRFEGRAFSTTIFNDTFQCAFIG
jgi:hypothetical protein